MPGNVPDALFTNVGIFEQFGQGMVSQVVHADGCKPDSLGLGRLLGVAAFFQIWSSRVAHRRWAHRQSHPTPSTDDEESDADVGMKRIEQEIVVIHIVDVAVVGE